MAQSQEKDSTTLVGLRGYVVERVVEEKKNIIAEARSAEADELKCP